jgi:transposase
MQEKNKSNVDYKSKQIAHLLYPPLNDVEAAKFLGVSKQTLRNWRSKGSGKGPAYVKLSPGPRGRVVYLLEDLQAYRDRCRIDPEAK